MSHDSLKTLASLLLQERSKILTHWRERVRKLPSARNLDTPSLNDHMPALIDEIAIALETTSLQELPESLNDGNPGSPPAHATQRHKNGFDIEEVVAEYNILRGCVQDLAEEHGLTIAGTPNRILNNVLDKAIAMAVRTFAEHKTQELQRRREEYLAFVAHDLRTPLNAITLAVRIIDMALLDNENRPQLSSILKTLQRNVRHLDGLVAKVLDENLHLDSDKGVKLERRELDLWPFVESIVYDLRPIGSVTNTQLVNHVPEDLIIYADANLLRRVFQNLLTNAIKHTPGGIVMVTARQPDSGIIECQVSDNGAGIPEDRLPHVFEKFETDAPPGTGLGLGLAIVKTFIEAHGGQVTVESKLGAGSTFRFTLENKVMSR
jgi:signal transduction histidine kinase